MSEGLMSSGEMSKENIPWIELSKAQQSQSDVQRMYEMSSSELSLWANVRNVQQRTVSVGECTKCPAANCLCGRMYEMSSIELSLWANVRNVQQ